MSRFKVILTSDYEVWGNGSGCVENCLIDPAAEMMKIAEENDSRITFFFDVCEYWAFENIERQGRFKGSYKPATLIKEQLQEAVKNGHDVQLHFHPQWLNYEFVSNQKWKLDYRYWSLPKVNEYHNDDWNLEKLFSSGIETLNSMFKTVSCDYSVFAFRAGAWSIQPEEEILSVMRSNDLRIDSTVAPKKKFNDGLTEFNFTDIPDKPFWKTGVRLNSEGKGIIEIPIGTAKLDLLERVGFKSKKIKYINRLFPKGCEKRKIQNQDKKKINVDSKEIRMLNFSDASSFEEMKFITNKLVEKFSKSQFSQFKSIPLVAISHPKSFGVSKPFRKYLNWIKKCENIELMALRDFYSEQFGRNEEI